MRWVAGILSVSGIAVLATAGYLWWAMLSPFSYNFPEEMIDHHNDANYPVFVYGTLTHAPVRWLVTGQAGDPTPYVLQDYRKEGLDIRPSPGDQVEGLLWDVTPIELRRLDRYERIGIRYLREQITLDDGRTAWIYRRMTEDD